MSADDAYEIERCGFRLESPIDGQEIVDAKGDEIAGDERYLIGRKEAHQIENGCVDHRADAAYDAEADKLLRLFVAEELS